MQPVQDDEVPVSLLPDTLLQELASLRERCNQLDGSLGVAEKAQEGLVERLYDAEHAREMAESRAQMHTDVLRETQAQLSERDAEIRRLKLVLDLALGYGQTHKDDTMRELWSLATGDPPLCGRKRKFAETAD